ncbi:hypothetical protein BDA96_04G033800 [Sorghum bicolor]|uniref:Uncharacterized protein n=1 Tax=Sorghum bicolor TaxID=4558 RepID=A0A921R052_SORBI|nr:hypothetical protein BDA96_04G033800 [Sorghum bicolor]
MKATAAANMRWRSETNTKIGTVHAKAVLSFYAGHQSHNHLQISELISSPDVYMGCQFEQFLPAREIFEDHVCRTNKKERGVLKPYITKV